MSNENDLISLAVFRAKREMGRTQLDFQSEVLPYLTEHKDELNKSLEEMNMFRRRLLLDEIEKKQNEMDVMKALLSNCE